MLNDLFEQLEQETKDIPNEIGTEAIHQVKGDDKANQQKQQQNDDVQNQNYLNELYGSSSLTPQQIKQKEEQDQKIIRQRYQQIQQDLAEYRAKKTQEVSKEEIGQQGLKTARTQEEKKELWEEQQEEAEKKKKEEDSIRLPGSAQSRSGEQQKIMG